MFLYVRPNRGYQTSKCHHVARSRRRATRRVCRPVSIATDRKLIEARGRAEFDVQRAAGSLRIVGLEVERAEWVAWGDDAAVGVTLFDRSVARHRAVRSIGDSAPAETSPPLATMSDPVPVPASPMVRTPILTHNEPSTTTVPAEPADRPMRPLYSRLWPHQGYPAGRCRRSRLRHAIILPPGADAADSHRAVGAAAVADVRFRLETFAPFRIFGVPVPK